MIGFVKTSLQSIKDLCQLDFFTKSLTFCFVLIYWLCWAESTASTAALQQKKECQIFKVNYLWLKKFDTKINAILLISELMASVRKVLRHFYRHLTTIAGPWYFGRVLVPLRLKNQSLYHKILLLQKFNDISGKVLKPKKIQPPTSKK